MIENIKAVFFDLDYASFRYFIKLDNQSKQRKNNIYSFSISIYYVIKTSTIRLISKYTIYPVTWYSGYNFFNTF